MRRGLTFDDVLLVPKYNEISSRKDVSTQTTLGPLSYLVPIASSNMDTITEDVMAQYIESIGGLALLHRFNTIEQNLVLWQKSQSTLASPNYVGISIGVGSSAIERAEALVSAGARIICIDIAHGHSQDVKNTILELRRLNGSNVIIIAGNVATLEGTKYLVEAGADIVKVGIGSGSVCSTRIKTGCGMPQLTAIQDCSRSGFPIIADGGVRTPGDVVKSLAVGAGMVMLGGMLAATDKTPGECISDPLTSIEYKIFRGMASREAQESFMGGMSDWKAAEGISTKILYKGPTSDTIKDLLGGLRSGMTYCGASTIKDLLKAEFIEITSASQIESTPHANRGI
jgi:IMP dehydrogenase